jgi:DNA-directed RNA polymerase specialized sigma54-like protein
MIQTEVLLKSDARIRESVDLAVHWGFSVSTLSRAVKNRKLAIDSAPLGFILHFKTSMRTTPLETTRPSTIFCRLLLN